MGCFWRQADDALARGWLVDSFNSQGWRLDPLLLFGQLLTAGTATAFALEVFRLRESIAVREVNLYFCAMARP